ncbi:WhiB family transcriptional regulator [Demequina sp. TTPB684]|uniref:WhiB family transcriptional regulator n=1 Tax=unclassified Demequina TaxID=2620311 RepID=UPI001CF1B23F|nr:MULTISPECIES: WhiB family transcriptional regulator [unclassified Demequina]MCB2413673.1 WhiB family transcriptional regulator [Demequina sp. TTPB684]UPU87735.1 WhiB family transcriptional regulator [Demequina sp. TMPB413]
MRTLTADTQRCKPPVESLPRAFTVPAQQLSRAEIDEARTFCGNCSVIATCRDFAYVTRMPGFVAGTTEADRAEVLDSARQYVAQQRAIAHAAGKPFSHAERDRVFQAAVRGAHLFKALGPRPAPEVTV